MMKIELSSGQKLQVGFIAAVMVMVVFLLVRAAKVDLDTAVNSWTTVRNYPVDLTKPVSQTNPWDLKKQTTENVFACYDGQLVINEYRRDPTRASTITWLKIDARRKNFLYYYDPMKTVKAIKKPYEHAIALAAFSAANGRSLGLLGGTSLTAEQLTAEKAARDVMTNSITIIKGSVENGTFHPELRDKALAALAEYKKHEGDPLKDKAKADLARKVLAAAAEYLAKIEQEKEVSIQKYISKMDEILKSEQKELLAKAGAAYEANGGRGANRPPVPPAPNRGAVPNRGTRGSEGTPSRGTRGTLPAANRARGNG